ncbi:cation acetate symporter [Micromonospora sp. WMMD1155]|uniref:solute symporter family protein n=1 Tax=Micromonospora sp. WMMD1155 TaxID=3016094 RepID=UPI00249C0A50|nr:cation acetate symporter [Micromonospora sp. WMMD1155]WFE51098.1 cation acetate symporter [Micromonospora sp. WMMD1155]
MKTVHAVETFLAAEAGNHTARNLTITLFLVFVAVTLGITIWASRQTKTATDFYAGGRSFSGFQNGMAIGGDYMSAASFLGIAGIIALYGYDGFLYSIGFLVAWLVALLLVAELLRNSGRYTMADVLAFRMRQRPVRTAAAVSTITVSIFYLLAQMVGAGALVALLLGIRPGTTFLGMDADTAKVATIIMVGALMIIYVTVGGMKGTTYVQIVKAFLLMGGALLMTILVLAKFNFNLSALLGQAAEASGKGGAFLEPGLRYGVEVAGNSTQTFYNKVDLLSLGIALVLGTAGLPHILIRFYTVPTAKAARKSVLWAIGIIGTFYLLTLALGFGAAALVGGQAITAQDKAGNTAAPQLAEALGIDFFGGELGGAALLAIIAAVAFATILAVVAGLTLASSSSLAHDFYANVLKRGEASERQEVRVARISALAIGAVSIALSIFAQNLNVAFLVALAFAVAASGNLPAILYSLFWRRFNTSGAVWAIYGGLLSAVVLVFFSPVVSGAATSMFPDHDWQWFPLSNPGILSIPFGFLCGWIGTVISKEHDEDKYAELEVRALTGAGAH